MNKDEKIINKTIIENLPKGEFEIFLFGSRAKGNFKKNSDYDIGILGKNKIKFNDFLSLKSKVEELPYLIDIVDFNNVSNEFKELALKHTKKWN